MQRGKRIPGLVLVALSMMASGCMSGQPMRPLFESLNAGSQQLASPAFQPSPQPEMMPQQMMPLRPMPAPAPNLPTEKQKVTHPEYMIEIPDILMIDVIRAIPRGPYLIQPLDAIAIYCPAALRDEPIAGVYQVGPEGRVQLGPSYGSVLVADFTIEQAEEAIRRHLATIIAKPKVTASLASIGSVQQVRGEHIVNPDGTVRLGKYGSVYICGMTLDQAKAAIERHLSAELVRPEVSLSIYAYNSKFYYVITDGAGYGEQVFRFPSTGNETVLDAMSMIGGLPIVASKRRIWVARPSAPGSGCQDQILPIDWCGITRAGDTRTNYQLLPGDRVYVMAQPYITATTWINRALEPIERLLGVTLLGATTEQTISGKIFARRELVWRGKHKRKIRFENHECRPWHLSRTLPALGICRRNDQRHRATVVECLIPALPRN